MGTQRPVHFLASLLILLCLCPLRNAGTIANPVYPDQDSIDNGAQLYDLYCSSCHGSDETSPSSPLYQANAAKVDKYSVRAAEEQRKEMREALELAKAKKAPWPAWAGPDPDADKPPDPKEQSASELRAMINKAHGIKPDSAAQAESDSAPAASTALRFAPSPGATNLADPTTYFYGTSEQEMFNSIANGTGTSMVGWRNELGNDNAIWDVVNYLRSLWGEEWRE